MLFTTMLAALLVAGPAFASRAGGTATIALVPLTGPLSNPVAITNAHDGSGRLFITLQDGRVMIHDGCIVRLTPFLDIRSLVRSGGEQGLLSIAFHPAFPATPYFYVYYTRLADGAIVIARYRLLTTDQADPTSAAILLTIPHSAASNHNGGQLQFGPDGYLYIGTGDGGSANDPPCNAQNNDTLLGRILRIDVNQSFDTPPYYGIPPTNPGTVGLPETWAKGMRNPWRFSFDRTTGDLLIGDVGQGAHEEVDFQAAGAPGGRNYGWKVMEGFGCTGTSTATCTVTPPACNSPSYTLPIFDYGHTSGRCSITGGYRYRGTQIPALVGNYLYADYCTGEIFQATESGGVWTSGPPFSSFMSISAFGEDEVGEMYVATLNSGVYRIVGAGAGLNEADLSVTKTDGLTTAIAGLPVTYTIAVSNAGPATAFSALVMDTFPAALQSVSWTCAASAGSSCCSIVGGDTLINRPVTILPGGTVTFLANATIDSSATGTVSNTATVVAPVSVSDPNPANDSATDTDTLVAIADLSITKTDGRPTAAPGSPITYTIAATNAGPSSVTGATVADVVPADVLGASWSCVSALGATCSAGGSGSINDSVNLPPGGTVTYTLLGMVSTSAAGTLTNTATVAPPGPVTDPDPDNNSATDTDTFAGLDYFTLTPCRVVDTRGLGAPIGGPVLQGQETRTLAVGGHCGIPTTAKALSINVTATQASAPGFIRLFAPGQPPPTTSSVNYKAGQTRANNAVVSLNGSAAMAAFTGQPAGTTVHVIIDVNGYFE